MTRFVPVCVAILGLTAGVARGEGMLPNGAEITFERFFIVEDGEFQEPSTPDAARQYLNFAHCACSAASAGEETTFQYELSLSATTGTARPGDVFVGTNCFDELTRPMNCKQIVDQTIGDIDALAVQPDRIEVGLFDAVNVNTAGACMEREGTASVWVLVDSDGDTQYDYAKSTLVGQTATSTEVAGIDTQKPPLPTSFSATAGEGSIQIEWEIPSSRATDLYAFQALCMDASGAPVTSEPPEALYDTTTELCGITQDFDLVASPIESDGTDVTAAPAEFRELSSAFICGEQLSGTATSLRIEGLDNDVEYTVALVAIDFYGNAIGTFFTKTIIPRPVTDFWEDLHDRGSLVEGGCLLSETYGEGSSLTRTLRSFRDHTLADTMLGRALIDAYYATLGKLAVEGSMPLRVLAAILLAPLVVVALLWHVLTLPGLLALIAVSIAWRRRRRGSRPSARLAARLAPASAVVALVLGLPTAAHADDFTPYWEDPSAQTDDDEDVVKWHAGIRLGPYIPEIDLQAGLNALTGLGPYEAMFGDYYIDGEKTESRVWQVLPMLDVDRIVWRGFGQLGVGGSIGYMQKTAYAYLNGTSEDELMRPRTTAGENTFRLIPMAATVSYRFTYLDEAYGIPVVPYLRAGLSYYAWWLKAPNGDLGRVCKDEMATAPCDYDKAKGGSLGYQGSIGLAIRAERIDPSAAMSMRNSGIKHAGFYGEYQYAKVDGFGSETKLSVGDNTWFAGVNFEF